MKKFLIAGSSLAAVAAAGSAGAVDVTLGGSIDMGVGCGGGRGGCTELSAKLKNGADPAVRLGRGGPSARVGRSVGGRHVACARTVSSETVPKCV